MLCMSWESLVDIAREGCLICHPRLSKQTLFEEACEQVKGGAYIDYQICKVRLETQLQLLIHTESVHGTVSRGPVERLIA